jgi:[ribosomal protein S18]-alanine N-acetyltransferase
LIPKRKIEIRHARRSDLDRIVEIEKLSFSSEAWNRDLFLDYLLGCPGLFLVAKVGRRIAGYSITCATRSGAELVSIAVDPAFREHGVGTAMMNYTAAKLKRRGESNWSLNVRIKNEGAIRLYRQFGFVRSRTLRGYYEDGGDAWRMRLKVKTK